MDLHAERKRWVAMIQGAHSKDEILLDEPLDFNVDDVTGPAILEVDRDLMPRRGTRFGKCSRCGNWRRLWDEICAWCGSDPEAVEE